MNVIKSEWHQVEVQYKLELDDGLIKEIYSDLDEEELEQVLLEIENGEIDAISILDHAMENDIFLEWEWHGEDWWTDRKGGYDVTYAIGEDD